jgi:hypothetical protein
MKRNPWLYLVATFAICGGAFRALLRWRILLVAVALIAGSLPFASSSSSAAGSQTSANIAGAWAISNGDTWVFALTAPNTYSVSNTEGFTVTDISISTSGSGASVTTCWSGMTIINSDCPAGDVPGNAYFIVPMNFKFPAGGPNTLSGTIQEFNSDGTPTYGAATPYTATQTSCTGGCSSMSASLSASMTLSRSTAAPGDQVKATVTVAASGGDVNSITLGDGLTSSDDTVASVVPGSLSGFSLGDGDSKKLTFTVKSESVGSTQLTLTASGTTSSGASVQAAAQATLTVTAVALSVADVTLGTGALSADVQVKLKDSSTDDSGCDPKASYNFADPQLASVKKVGPCNYELTFESPGTGIYHVSLKATVPSGVVVPVSVDQYGETVDGQFTLIIDSCSQPDDDVPDVDALLDADNGLCDVAVGNWDSDAADVAAKVLAAVESSPTLAVDPVSVDAVDPSDWPGSRGLVLKGKTGSKGLVLKSTDTGWIPIGTKDPPELGREGKSADVSGDAAALIREVKTLPGLPHLWSGASDGIWHPKTETRTCAGVNLNDRPSAVVISSHGVWYTGNGLVRVPTGDQVSTYVPLTTTMGSECLGQDIDTGHVHGGDTKYLHIYVAGQLMPNFTFIHYDYPDQGKYVTNVTDPTTLNNLIRPGEGRIAIAACAQLFIPAGVALTQAFSSLPIHTPGTGQPVGYSRVSITQNGEIQTTPASS